MREIVLDTETTGLDPDDGHRVVEIAGVELFNHLPTGRVFHCYINPERSMPAEAEAVHGLTEEFLASHPVFAEHVEALIEFLGTARLVIHNAEFDIRFLNAELKRLDPITRQREREFAYFNSEDFPRTLAAHGVALAVPAGDGG